MVLGGYNITMGYYKMPEKTEESYRVDRYGQRWFYTGDIGEIEADGSLKIVGKNCEQDQ